MKQQDFNPRLFFNYSSENIRTPRERTVLNFWYFLSSNEVSTGIFFHPRKSIKEEKLETEGPLAEKDEVKKAEQRTMEQQTKVEKQPPLKGKK